MIKKNLILMALLFMSCSSPKEILEGDCTTTESVILTANEFIKKEGIDINHNNVEVIDNGNTFIILYSPNSDRVLNKGEFRVGGGAKLILDKKNCRIVLWERYQ